MHRSITTTALVIAAMRILTGDGMVNGDWTPGPAAMEMTRVSNDFAVAGQRVSTASSTRSELASTRGVDHGGDLWNWPEARVRFDRPPRALPLPLRRVVAGSDGPNLDQVAA